MYTNRKLKYNFNKPIKVWVWKGTVDHIGEIVDHTVISKLRRIQESNGGIDFTKLDSLDLDSCYKL